MAKLNPFRFSTKYQDDEIDFLYYGYRYYNPSAGRWLSRNPLEEKGGLNLFAFAGNAPTIDADADGRIWVLLDGEAWTHMFHDIGTGVYDWMMGNPKPSDPNTQGAQQAAMLGGIDIHDNVLRDSMGQATEIAGNAAKEAAIQYGEAKVTAVAIGITGELLCQAKATIGVATVDAKRIMNGVGATANITTSTTEEAVIRLHHPWPKYLGGAEDQDLTTQSLGLTTFS